MPIGGTNHGYKGYALTLMKELLTRALGGYGRQTGTPGIANTDGESNSLFLQVTDPTAFADWNDYVAQADGLVQDCVSCAPDDPQVAVRVPGQSACRRRTQQLAEGVTLYAGVFEALTTWALRYGIEPPAPIANS